MLGTRSLHWCQMRRRHTSWTFRKPAGSSLDLWIQPTDWLALCFKWTLVQFDAVAAGSMANLVYQTPCDLLCCSAAFSWNARRLKWTPLNFADTLSPLVSKWFKTLSNNKRVVSIFPFCSAGHFMIAHDTSIHLHPAFYDVLPCQIELPNIASHHRVEMYRFDEDWGKRRCS